MTNNAFLEQDSNQINPQIGVDLESFFDGQVNADEGLPGQDLFGEDLFGEDLPDEVLLGDMATDGEGFGEDIINEMLGEAFTGETITDFIPNFGPLPTASATAHIPTQTSNQDLLAPSANLSMAVAPPRLVGTDVVASPVRDTSFVSAFPNVVCPQPQQPIGVAQLTITDGHRPPSDCASPVILAAAPVLANETIFFPGLERPASIINAATTNKDITGLPLQVSNAEPAAYSIVLTPSIFPSMPQRASVSVAGVQTADARVLPSRYQVAHTASTQLSDRAAKWHKESAVTCSPQAPAHGRRCVAPYSHLEIVDKLKRFLNIVDLSSRPAGTIKPGADPKLWYPGLGRPLEPWGPAGKFSYTPSGELSPRFRFDGKDFKEYLQKPGLQLLVQRMPAAQHHRYPNGQDSTKCRFLKCAGLHNTIQKGHLRVALVEYPEISGTLLDPFHCAGYVHLWCLETHVDVVRLFEADNGFFKCDDRELYYEDNAPMTLIRELPMRRAFSNWIAAEGAKKARAEWEKAAYGHASSPYSWAARTQLKRGSGDVIEGAGASLTEAMAAVYVDSKHWFQRYEVEARNPGGLYIHHGNLAVLERMAKQVKSDARVAQLEQARAHLRQRDLPEGRGRREGSVAREARSRSTSPPRIASPQGTSSYRERNYGTAMPAARGRWDGRQQHSHAPGAFAPDFAAPNMHLYPSVLSLYDPEAPARVWEQRERDLAKDQGLVLGTRKRIRVQDAAEELAIDAGMRKKQQMRLRFSA